MICLELLEFSKLVSNRVKKAVTGLSDSGCNAIEIRGVMNISLPLLQKTGDAPSSGQGGAENSDKNLDLSKSFGALFDKGSAEHAPSEAEALPFADVEAQSTEPEAVSTDAPEAELDQSLSETAVPDVEPEVTFEAKSVFPSEHIAPGIQNSRQGQADIATDITHAPGARASVVDPVESSLPSATVSPQADGLKKQDANRIGLHESAPLEKKAPIQTDAMQPDENRLSAFGTFDAGNSSSARVKPDAAPPSTTPAEAAFKAGRIVDNAAGQVKVETPRNESGRMPPDVSEQSVQTVSDGAAKVPASDLKTTSDRPLIPTDRPFIPSDRPFIPETAVLARAVKEQSETDLADSLQDSSKAKSELKPEPVSLPSVARSNTEVTPASLPAAPPMRVNSGFGSAAGALLGRAKLPVDATAVEEFHSSRDAMSGLAARIESSAASSSSWSVSSEIATQRGDTVRSAAAQAAEILVRQPGKQVEISLNPQELGRVRMALLTSDNGVTVMIQSERPETLDLMRRHVDQLAQEFKDLGYEQTSFQFSDGKSGEDRPFQGQTGPVAADSEEPSGDPKLFPTRLVSAGLDLRL